MKLNSILIISCILLIISCEKDDTKKSCFDFKNTCILEKINDAYGYINYSFDNDKLIKVENESYSIQFEYDNNCMITKETYSYKNDPDKNFYNEFSYSGSTITKVTSKNSSITYFKLNSNNEIIKVELEDVYYLFEWTNGNITEQTVWDKSTNKKESTYSYSYNSKKSPVYMLYIIKGSIYGNNSWKTRSKNNPVKRQTSSGVTCDIDYQYNSNDFPVSADYSYVEKYSYISGGYLVTGTSSWEEYETFEYNCP